LNGGVKKWFMLQLWRVQQVAQLLTIAMLAFTISLQIYPYVSWRFEGTVLEGTYPSVTIIMLTIAACVWTFAFIWDIRLKMWREQQMVLIERNPYAKEKMAAKEIVIYQLSWLPLMEKLGKDDPEIKEAARSLRAWIDRLASEDPILKYDIEQVFKFVDDEKL
jgi:hypothetical protein